MDTMKKGLLTATWLLAAASILLASACSPLRLVSGIALQGDNVVISSFDYGPEKRHKLDVYVPEEIRENSPVVVFFYGGSWKRGEKEKYGFVGHSLSRKGYVTVIPNYRLYPEVIFPAFVEDGALAIAWLRQHVDQAKNGVVVMGHSAGAHIAALLALDREYLEKVGQSQQTIRGMIGLAGPYGFDPLQYRSTRPIFSGTVPLEKMQPVHFACANTSPLLLFHGEDDSLVIAENSRDLSRKVAECGGNVEYFELADVNHISIVLGLADSFLGKEEILSPIAYFLQSLSSQKMVI
jgi:acetyl esterase/lipase